MNVSRRDLSLLLPALLAANAEGQTAAAGKAEVLPSKAYVWDNLPVHKDPKNGMEVRSGFKGATHIGCVLGMHLSSLPPGQMPHAPHHHVHEEMMLVREGTVDATVAGHTTRLGPGSVSYVASNEEHSLKNVGTVTAQYFVIELGAA
jgi:mannose-6-phosphate isomerase-like protein (cupin superfamily)